MAAMERTPCHPRSRRNHPARLAGLALSGLLAAVPAGLADAEESLRPLDRFSYETWQTSDGLPQNSVHAIVQTRDGYLWMGTQEGLVRFDGVRFVVFRRTTTPQMRSDHVTALCETRDGTLWAGTFGGGLVSVKDGRFKGYSTADGLTNDTVVGLAEDRAGALWIATQGGGLAKLDTTGFTAYSIGDGLGSATTSSVVIDASGTVWAGTAGGVSRLDGGRFVTYTSRDGLAGDSVTALAADAAGVVWIGTTRGLTRWRGRAPDPGAATGAWPRDPVQALHVDASGHLWAGTQAGVFRLAGGRVETLTIHDGLVSNNITAIFQDREGSHWIGMDGGGVSRWRDSTFANVGAPHGLQHESAYSITGSRDGGFWVGTDMGTVFRFKNDRFTRYAVDLPLRATTVRALLEDRAGYLWIGTEQQLTRCRDGRCAVFDASHGLPAFTVRALFEDRDGRLWVGTDGGGLSRLDGDRLVTYTTKDGLAGNRVRAIVHAADGGIWIGCYGGLNHFKDGLFRTYTKANGLSHDFVRALHEDADGVLWIGTYGGGLNRLKDGRFSAYTTADGLYSDAMFQVLDDGLGYLWVSSNTGVFRVGKAQIEALAAGRVATISSTAYDETDGMKSRECNGGNPAGWRDRDGRLWFPTLRGVATVAPGDLRENRLPPPVVVEEVAVDGRRIAAGEHLPPGSRRFEFRYTGLSFVAQSRMRFEHQLEGFDQDWVDAGTQRSAVYTNIPPGTYRFAVKAVSGDGVPSVASASIRFVLRPYFYQTWAFYAACGLLLAGAFGGFYHWRTQQLRVRERVLKEKVAEAVAHIKTLRGMLPICASCKRVRDDGGYWNQIEAYVREHSEAVFSHGICPDCMQKLYPDDVLELGGPPTQPLSGAAGPD